MNKDFAKPKKMNVKLEANLFEVGVPLVVLLTRKAGAGTQSFIATAIPDEAGEVDYYFVVFVARQHLIRYFNNQCDLRFLYEHASGRKFFLALDLAVSPKGTIQIEEYLGVVEEYMLPDGQFFAAAHTSKYGISDAAGKDQKLLMDGHWEMQEFGNFYQKFSDLYSFSQAVAYIRNQNAQRAKQVENAFAKKPFKGGSSYMGFFGDLFDIIPPQERPSLKGIEYHSPGWVELRGKDDILESVKMSVNLFLQKSDEIQKAHDDLRSFMSQGKLLSIVGGVRELGKDDLAELSALTQRFYDLLPVDGKEHLAGLTKGNLVVRAKVGLALFRRLRATAYFFAQGRLAYQD